MATDSITQRTRIFKELFQMGKKNIIMTGDSISYRLSLEINLSNYVYRKSGNHYLYTQGISGSNMANFIGGDSATWNPLSFVTRSDDSEINSFYIQNCDVLLVWAGFNDLNDDIPLGEIGSVDPFTYGGAIKLGINNYLLRNPQMQVMFITPNSNPYTSANGVGLTLNDYRTHMKAVCANIGVPCYDLYAVDGITEENKAEKLPDTIHPTQAVLEGWAPMLAEFVNNNS